MATAGLGQGLALSIALHSIYLMSYFILGALIWQFVVRPIEEKNMLQRFGKEYVNYKIKVKCWIPRIH